MHAFPWSRCSCANHTRPRPRMSKDCIPDTIIPHPTSIQTPLRHIRSTGIGHITITPHNEDGYVDFLLVVEHDTKYPVAYSFRDYSATTVSTVLFKKFFDFIYSDHDTSLMSNIVSDLNVWLGIHRVPLIGCHVVLSTMNAWFIVGLQIPFFHGRQLRPRWSVPHRPQIWHRRLQEITFTPGPWPPLW